jgi:hypothetical protein
MNPLITLSCAIFLDHFDIFFRADRGTITATLAEIRIKIIIILALPGYTSLGADNQTHITGDAFFLKELGPQFSTPRAGLIIPA